MAPWHLLEPKEEENLHKTRLLNVEERPFLRITKRMQTAHTIAKWGKPPANSNPPQQNGAAAATSAPPSQPTSPTTPASAAITPASSQPDPAVAAELAALREEVTLDFAAFDFTVARFQSLLNANAEERARYNADRQTILDQCAAVRDSTSGLRARLDGARAQLERRRRFDDLADRITSNRALRPRAEQHHALAKLEDECANLEAESAQYAATWRERRDQFARIMDESMRLRRQIRDEADEVDRREGMGDEREDDAAVDGQTPRPGVASGNVTPMPHGGGGGGGGGGGNNSLLPPKVLAGLAAEAAESSAGRSGSSFGGRTPARDSPAPQDMLKPRPDASGTGGSSRPQSQDGTSAATPMAASVATPAPEEGDDGEGRREEDVDMDDAGAAADGTPRGGNDESQASAAGTPGLEEKMDTT
ncbi:hypothetical protein RB596_004795 [Gaeumannomyces avenae]